MERLTNEQRLQVVEIYHQNSCFVYRLVRSPCGRNNRLSELIIRAIILKFRTKSTKKILQPKWPVLMTILKCQVIAVLNNWACVITWSNYNNT